jgi:diguanylate cyclase (GGDEF)-like protein
VYVRTSALIGESALNTARSYADLITATRLWNESHEGVWVTKGPDTATDPYLLHLGVSADATTTDGRVLTLRGADSMAHEISNVQKRSDGTYFRLTSLRPVDPNDAPDAWEKAALAAFEGGTAERYEMTQLSGVPVLRYARPLITDASCLPCHGRQGFKVGDVRGAVSIVVPENALQGQAAFNAGVIGLAGLIATLVMLAVTLTLVRRLRSQLDLAQAALVEAATVDVLTGVATRRQAMIGLQAEIDRAERTREPVAVIMIDIDRFKDVNDSLGHAAGDTVLAHVARRIGDTLRPYDVFGRIGGEEFLIVAPGTGLEEGIAIAERARAAVSATPVPAGGESVFTTISLGVTLLDPTEPEALDRAMARADQALYDAKDNGRNRTSVSIAEL